MTSSQVFYLEPDQSSSPVVLRSATSGFLEQQERDPSPPSVTFGSASHPVLSHAPLRIGCCALGFAACTRSTVIVPGTTGRSSSGQSAKVQFILQIKRAGGQKSRFIALGCIGTGCSYFVGYYRTRAVILIRGGGGKKLSVNGFVLIG